MAVSQFLAKMPLYIQCKQYLFAIHYSMDNLVYYMMHRDIAAT